MEEMLAVATIALLTVAFTETLAPRLRIASPLILVLLGIAVSLLPATPDIVVDPHWILAGILPPLLYGAAVSMPAVDFRRDIQAISGLAVALVIVSTILMGLLFHALLPTLSLPAAFALGAIVSPTDAVAASIVRDVGVSRRLTAMLEGESLLNDATALALLRSALAVTVLDSMAVTASGVAWDFLRSLLIAIPLGWFVGWVNLRIRAHISEAPVNTVISFTIPFVASIPADLLGASGLVAAVVAGLVTGHGAAKFLRPEHRASDMRTWRAIELALEGVVFLIMGLEMDAILHDLNSESLVWMGARVALIGLGAVLLIRALYVSLQVWQINRSAVRSRQRYDQMKEVISEIRETDPHALPVFTPQERRLWRRKRNDLRFYESSPLGWREGAILTWGGMRGVVTLVAAQTVPESVPHRSLIVFIAFVVAATSLLVQGGTLEALVKWVKPLSANEEELERQRRSLREDLQTVSIEVLETAGMDTEALKTFQDHVSEAVTSADIETPDAEAVRRFRVKMIQAQRREVLRARAEGKYDSQILAHALRSLDTEQIALETRSFE